MLNTFVFVTVAWVFFRAESIVSAFEYFRRIIDEIVFNPKQLLHLPRANGIDDIFVQLLIPMILLFLIAEWHLKVGGKYFTNKFAYLILAFLVIWFLFGELHKSEFIYFQF